MKATEIRTWTSGEMQQKVTELKEELFNLRFQRGGGQIENPQKIRQIKRDVARIKTVMNEKRSIS